MECASLLTRKIFNLLLFVSISLLFCPLSGYSEVFNVTNEDELKSALSAAESNGEDDTINIAAGLYHTDGEPFIYESDEDFPLTMEGDGAGSTILDGDGLSRVLSIEFLAEGSVLERYIVAIKYLTIRNGNNQSMKFSDYNGGGLFIYRAESVTIDHCNLIDNIATNGNGGGAYIIANNLYLFSNKFYYNSSGLQGGGLFNESSDVYSTNNIFTGNSSSASGYGGGGAAALYWLPGMLTITNNTFSLNTIYGQCFSPSQCAALSIFGIPNSDANVVNIYNNIVFGNDIINGADILVATEPLPVPTSLPGQTISPYTERFGRLNISNNDYSLYLLDMRPSGCDYSFVDCIIDVNKSHNINADPLFVDAESGDFNLMHDSACINAGDPNAPDVPDTDIYGNPRIPPPDMGAVEYVAEAATNGGCSLTSNPATSSLAVFLALPVLILIKRVIKRTKSS